MTCTLKKIDNNLIILYLVRNMFKGKKTPKQQKKEKMTKEQKEKIQQEKKQEEERKKMTQQEKKDEEERKKVFCCKLYHLYLV